MNAPVPALAASPLPPAVTDADVAALTEEDMFCIDMLGKGYDAKAVSSVTGMSIDAVRTLADKFMPAIIHTRVEQQTVELAMQDKAFAIEKLALDRLETAVRMETDSMKLMRIYNTMRLNNDKVRMEKKGLNPMGTTVINATVVRLEVPHALAQRQEFRDSITIDSASRVIAIGDKSVASASKNMIDTLAAARTAATNAPLTAEDFL